MTWLTWTCCEIIQKIFISNSGEPSQLEVEYWHDYQRAITYA